IARASNWLVSRQHRDGSWGVKQEQYARYNTYFTSYAMMSLAKAGPAYKDSVNRALRWLRGRQSTSGSFGDIASSLMAMSAVQLVTGSAFTLTLPIPIFLRIQA